MLVRICVLLIALAVPIGCSAKQVTLTFWEEPVAERFAAAQEIIAEFEKQNPDIIVEAMPTTGPPTRTTKLIAAVAAGQAPDVVSFWGADFRHLASQGIWLNLKPYMQKHLTRRDIDDFFPGQMRFMQLEDEQFGLPQHSGTTATYLNKTLFDEAGVLTPKSGWSIADFTSAGRKLTLDKDGDGQPDQYGYAFIRMSDRIATWVKRLGGDVFKNNDPRQFGLDQPASLAALQYLFDMLYTERFSPVSTAAAWRIQSGHIGMEENGPWQVVGAKLYETPFDLRVVEPPQGPKGPASLLVSDGYAIVAASKHPDEAWRLLQFLTSQYANKVRAVSAGLQPSRRSVAKTWIDNMPRSFPALAGVDWTTFFRIAEYSDPEPVFYHHTDVWRILTPAMNSIWAGTPPQTAIARVVDSIKALLSQ